MSTISLATVDKTHCIGNPRQADTRFINLGNSQTDFPPISVINWTYPEPGVFANSQPVSAMQVFPRYAQLVYVVNGTTGYQAPSPMGAVAPAANAINRVSLTTNLAKDNLALDANPSRKFFTVDNHSTKAVYLSYGSTPASVNPGKYDIKIPAGSATFRETQWQGEVHIITDPAVDGFINVSEYY